MTKLTMTRKTFDEYRSTVRGNENITLEEALKKLQRNIELAECRPRENGNYYAYGKLHFIVSEKNVVVWLKNNCTAPKEWKKDNKKYLKISKELDISDRETHLTLMARNSFFTIRRKYGKIKWKMKNGMIYK